MRRRFRQQRDIRQRLARRGDGLGVHIVDQPEAGLGKGQFGFELDEILFAAFFAPM